MKRTVTQKFHIHAEKSYCGEVSFKLFMIDMSEYGYVCIGEFEKDIEFDVPDNFSFEFEEIKSLREQKKKVQAQAQSMIDQIDEKIQRLLCIEHKAES